MNASRVKKELKQLIQYDPVYKAFREKTTKLPVLGLRVPVLKTFAKSLNVTLEELDALWHTSKTHESKSIPLFVLLEHKKNLGQKEWNVVKHWIEQIENWEHSDNLSSIYSRIFEHHPDLVLPTLKQWNASKNPWKQRASIVSLIFFASPKRKAPPVELILELIEPLIASKDMYVNKAVGWTLRESFKLYPKETYEFLKQHAQMLSANSFSYATEKVTKEQKTELKRLRAKH